MLSVYVQHRELEDRDVVSTEDYWIGEVKEIRANSHHDVRIPSIRMSGKHYAGLSRCGFESSGSGHHRRWQRSSNPCKLPVSPLLLMLRLGQSDPTICGRFEKLVSNNCDIISVHAIAGERTLSIQVTCLLHYSLDHVEVKHFDETSIYQALIEDDEWFSRYEFLYDAKRISVSCCCSSYF